MNYAVSIGVTAIILGLFVIGGITYTYMTRPALIEDAAKRVMDTRQLFEETFRWRSSEHDPPFDKLPWKGRAPPLTKV
jgi:hypothetical protein